MIDDELDIEGCLVDITYELGPRKIISSTWTGSNPVYGRRAQRYYFCESRGCGVSGLWANSLFKVRELYGPNGKQIYFAVKLAGETPRYLSAYGIERGNRRQYVHVRLVAPG